MSRHFLALLLLAVCLGSAPGLAQESGATNRATELKAEPRDAAATLVKLAAETAVTVQARQGGWMRIDAGGKLGWVRSFHVRVGGQVAATSESQGSSFLSALFPTRQAPTNQKTATLGIRGLSEEEMQRASPNSGEFNKLKSFTVSRAEASQFAQRARLAATSIEFVNADGKPQGGR